MFFLCFEAEFRAIIRRCFDVYRLLFEDFFVSFDGRLVVPLLHGCLTDLFYGLINKLLIADGLESLALIINWFEPYKDM